MSFVFFLAFDLRKLSRKIEGIEFLVGSEQNDEVTKQSRSSYWIGPLLAGVFFSLGYGTTQRIVGLRAIGRNSLPDPFELRVFEGVSLKDLRAQEMALSSNSELMADMAAIDAKMTEKEKAKFEVNVLLVEARRRKEELEYALKALKPLWHLSEKPLQARPVNDLIPEIIPLLRAPVMEVPFSSPPLSNNEILRPYTQMPPSP